MLWAAEAPAQGADFAGWLNYGVMGLLILGLVTGLFWVKPSVDRLKEEVAAAVARAEKADTQRDAMAETFQKEMLPALVKFLATSEALLPLLQRLVDKTGGEHR